MIIKRDGKEVITSIICEGLDFPLHPGDIVSCKNGYKFIWNLMHLLDKLDIEYVLGNKGDILIARDTRNPHSAVASPSLVAKHKIVEK